MKKANKRKEKSVVNKIFFISLCVLLTVYSITIIYTLFWGLLSSFKNPYEFSDSPLMNNWLGFPTLDSSVPWDSTDYLFKFQNYKTLVEGYPLVEANCDVTFIVDGKPVRHVATGGFPMVIVNTLLYTVVGAILHTIVPAVTAYAVAKYSNAVGKILTGVALFAMTTPIVGTQSSMLAMLRNMGIYDTFVGYLLQKASFGGMYYFVFLGFYESLPDSFAEAAEIDGASQFSVLVRIILPLSIKTLSTVFVIQFIAAWNDYQTAYMYMPSHPTLAYVVWFLTSNNQASGGGDMVVRVAGAMALAVPILVAFIFLKNKLMGNVTMGGLKQ